MILLALLLAQAAPQRVRVCDKADVTKCAAVNSSGQVSISGSISASTTGKATAAAPAYVEGTDNPLSIDLSGNIRTLATATTAAAATAANPAYVEGSTSALSQDLSGHLRVGATQAGSWTNACTQSGTWTVQPGNTANTTAWKVDGSAVTQPVSGTFWQATQPVSAAALPLPAGASTEATLALIKAKTDNLDVALSTRTKPADSQTVTGTVAATESGTWTVQPGNTANTTAWLVTGAGGTFPVTGTVAATQSGAPWTMDTIRINGTTILTGNGVTGAGSQRVTIASDQTAFGVNLAQYTPVAGRLPVDASGVTVPISAVSLPLPTGAASDATVAETHAVTLGSIPTRQEAIAGSDYGYSCNSGACSQIPRVDANGIQYAAIVNAVRVQSVAQPLNPLLPRCNAVRRSNCQP